MTGWHRFRRDETGGLSVEAVIVLPILFWVIMATYVYFDAFAQRNKLVKATYTVSDLLSRETRAVDTPYVQGVADVLDHLAGDRNDPRMRVSVIRCVSDCLDEETRVLALDWSRGVGLDALTDPQISAVAAGIPFMSVGARVIVVQSVIDYAPLFDVGLPTLAIVKKSVVRPRFAPRLCWETCDSGTAPGDVCGNSGIECS